MQSTEITFQDMARSVTEKMLDKYPDIFLVHKNDELVEVLRDVLTFGLSLQRHVAWQEQNRYGPEYEDLWQRHRRKLSRLKQKDGSFENLELMYKEFYGIGKSEGGSSKVDQTDGPTFELEDENGEIIPVRFAKPTHPYPNGSVKLSIEPIRYAFVQLVAFWETHFEKGQWNVQAQGKARSDTPLPPCQEFLLLIGELIDPNYKLRHWGSVERNLRKPVEAGRSPSDYHPDGSPVYKHGK